MSSRVSLVPLSAQTYRQLSIWTRALNVCFPGGRSSCQHIQCWHTGVGALSSLNWCVFSVFWGFFWTAFSKVTVFHLDKYIKAQIAMIWLLMLLPMFAGHTLLLLRNTYVLSFSSELIFVVATMHEVRKGPTRKKDYLKYAGRSTSANSIPQCTSCRENLNLQLLRKEKKKCSLTGCHVYEKWLCISAKRPGDVTRAIRSPADELQLKKKCATRSVTSAALASPRLASFRSSAETYNLSHFLTWCAAVFFFVFFAAGGSLPVCAGCKQRIYDEQYLQALNTDWHTVCFRYVEQQ